MAYAKCIVALSLIAAAAPLSAQAPAGTSETRYCMRIEAVTGNRVERVRCWTREQWARQGVDLDRDWRREGVRTLG